MVHATNIAHMTEQSLYNPCTLLARNNLFEARDDATTFHLGALYNSLHVHHSWLSNFPPWSNNVVALHQIFGDTIPLLQGNMQQFVTPHKLHIYLSLGSWLNMKKLIPSPYHSSSPSSAKLSTITLDGRAGPAGMSWSANQINQLNDFSFSNESRFQHGECICHAICKAKNMFDHNFF